MKDQLINKGKALLDEQLSAYGLGGCLAVEKGTQAARAAVRVARRPPRTA